LSKFVEVEAVSDNLAQSQACDIILTTLNIANRLEKTLSIPVVGLLNVMGEAEYKEKLLPVINQLLEAEGKL
jgi:galactitol-specific phosphotransferase system IIB component